MRGGEATGIRDVARIAGVSVSTASRALGPGGSVNSDIRIRVRAVAESIGYVASLPAQAMRGCRNLVCVIVDDVTTAPVGTMVAAMQSAGRSLGTLVTASGTGADVARTAETLRVFRGLHPRAIILISPGADAASDLAPLRTQLETFAHEGGRVVSLASPLWPDYSSVEVPQHELAREAAQFMASLGRRSALVLAGPPRHLAFAERARVFEETLRHSGMPETEITVTHTANTRDAGALAFRAQATVASPELVLAVSDGLAAGAVQAATSLGLRVPADVAVSGIDDAPIARYSFPALTTVAQPFDVMGRELFDLAVSADPTPRHIALRGSLIVRDSTPPRRAL